MANAAKTILQPLHKLVGMLVLFTCRKSFLYYLWYRMQLMLRETRMVDPPIDYRLQVW